jgi:hypothetical protein
MLIAEIIISYYYTIIPTITRTEMIKIYKKNIIVMILSEECVIFTQIYYPSNRVHVILFEFTQ